MGLNENMGYQSPGNHAIFRFPILCCESIMLGFISCCCLELLPFSFSSCLISFDPFPDPLSSFMLISSLCFLLLTSTLVPLVLERLTSSNLTLKHSWNMLCIILQISFWNFSLHRPYGVVPSTVVRPASLPLPPLDSTSSSSNFEQDDITSNPKSLP